MFQYVYAMMSRYVLQIRHDNFEFFALRHRVNTIIRQWLLVQITKQPACLKGASWFFSELNNSVL
jgi:hypothetical protein